jgi:hypothetical protein
MKMFALLSLDSLIYSSHHRTAVSLGIDRARERDDDEEEEASKLGVGVGRATVSREKEKLLVTDINLLFFSSRACTIRVCEREENYSCTVRLL